jgi:hypothetical protein
MKYRKNSILPLKVENRIRLSIAKLAAQRSPVARHTRFTKDRGPDSSLNKPVDEIQINDAYWYLQEMDRLDPLWFRNRPL